MKRVTILKELEKKPLFGIEHVMRITGKDREYSRLIVHRLEDKNLITRIEKGKYTTQDDPLVFATRLIRPSYFSLWTGLRYYDLTEQLPQTYCIMAPRNKKNIKLDSTELRFTKTKHMFGFHKVKHKGFEISIADKEKLLLDCLYSHKIMPNDLIELVKAIEFNKLLRFLKKIGSSSLVKRTGFLLDNYNSKIGEKETNKLKDLTRNDYNYILLDTNLSEKGEKIKEWKIIDNRRSK